jgi:hypothetical protein
VFNNSIIINRFGIYHWSDFKFEDGSTKDKYWIALNCTILQKEYYAILPTSQIKKYFSSIDILYIPANESKYFNKDTILDFKNIKVNTQEEIENIFNSNKLDYIGLLEKEIQNKIIVTIENAMTLSKNMIDQLLCR